MLTERIYELAVRAAVPTAHLVARFNERLQRGVRGRAAAMTSLRSLGSERDATRPRLWLHAPSVGEALMAQAILAAVKRREPRVHSAFTYFSPSAERMAARVGADWTGYLPWDRPRDVGLALDALQPSCIAFVRTEIWPVLVREATRRGISCVMVNAVLANDSSRLKGAPRALLAPGYARLVAVGAVSEEDARNLERLDVARDRIRITGDARFDQVWQRITAIDRERPLLRMVTAGSRLQLVAGSTWPRDEVIIVDALAGWKLRERWRAIVAPHEPTPVHITALEQRLDAGGLRHMRLPAEDDDVSIADDIDVIIVDRVGVLADLYAAADAAYVGGGFGSAGLHSVVEPAALGVPVLYGQKLGNAREAHRLMQAGGGFYVGGAASVAELLKDLAEDDAQRRKAGAAAREFVAAHTGGAERSADIIMEALRSGSAAAPEGSS